MTRYAKAILLISHQHDLLAWRRERISNHSIVLWLHRSTTRIEGRHSGLRHSVCTSRSFNLHGSVSWWPSTLIWGREKPRAKPSSGYSVIARSHSTMMANRHFPAASLILWRLKSIWLVPSAWWVCCYSLFKDIVRLQHSQIYSWTDAVKSFPTKTSCDDFTGHRLRPRCSHLWPSVLLHVLLFCCIGNDSRWFKGSKPQSEMPSLSTRTVSFPVFFCLLCFKDRMPWRSCYVPFQEGVHAGAVHLDELNILLSHRYSLLWWYVFSNCFRAAQSFLTVSRRTAALITGRSDFGPKE